MRRTLPAFFVLFVFVLFAEPLMANNECDQPDESPDVIVGDLHQIRRHGEIGGVTAFSIGTVSCNVGSCWLDWISDSTAHPVIAQNLFRLHDGRFEQIGQSWLKHGFYALSQSLCSSGCIGTDGTHLGVNCSDPYSSFLNGDQSGLGPKSEVNPATGSFSYPFGDQGTTGDVLYKRLQVRNDDLDPALFPGAQYWVEGQYVTADDAAAGNQNNNASHRPVAVTEAGGQFSLVLAGSVVREQPAIMSWGAIDPSVLTTDVDVPGDGRFVAASKATRTAPGVWSYEYAIHNLNSYRSGGGFRVPLPPGVTATNVGFHDVAYHSGETFSADDWSAVVSASQVEWQTEDVKLNADANALRWGTLYNFRFETDTAPRTGSATLKLFLPGVPAEVSWPAIVPSSCNEDGTCQPDESPCTCPHDCGQPTSVEQTCGDGIDNDCDGQIDCQDLDCCTDPACSVSQDLDGDGVGACDCDDSQPLYWATPGEVRELHMARDPKGATMLAWSPPSEPGGLVAQYTVLLSESPSTFNQLGTSCVQQVGTSFVDLGRPRPGAVGYYLVRAVNGCPDGYGSLGQDSAGNERSGGTCP